MSDRGEKRWAGWLLVGVGWLTLLVGSVVHSVHSPMWVDECYSYNLIADPSLAHMLAASGDQCDGAPPLYYLLIRPWAALFSTNELSLRLFSSVGFCAAFALLWRMLRRAFDFWPAAAALAVAVGTSNVIRFENSNVRFYGLLFALISLGALLATRFGERERPGWGLLAANAGTQAALVLCHPLGGVYGATLLAAVGVGDALLLRRLRWRVVLSYPAGWLALGLWARQMARQAAINQPHSWIPVPEYRDIAGALYGGSDFYPLFLLFVALIAVGLFAAPRAALEREGPVFSAGASRQLIIAGGLICLPLALWIFSRAVPSNPLFLSRYLIGVSIGWTIVLAQALTFLLRPLGQNRWARAVLAGFTALQLSTLISQPGPDNGGLAGDSDLAFGHADLPIVCLRSHDFLPREHSSPQAERYYFLLDWELAALPGNTRHATVEYKLLDALRRHYGAAYHHHIVQSRDFLRDHPAFLMPDIPWIASVILRLPPDQYNITHLSPASPVDYRRDGVWPMLLVERKR